MNIEELEKRLKFLAKKLDEDYFERKDQLLDFRKELDEINESKPIDHIGCYRKPLRLKQEYLYINQSSNIGQAKWYENDINFARLKSGNCYPLSMRTHLENAIECRATLIQDENVILGHNCGNGTEYLRIIIEQTGSREFKPVSISSTIYRGYWNWISSEELDKFINKWHDKLISMWFLGWL